MPAWATRKLYLFGVFCGFCVFNHRRQLLPFCHLVQDLTHPCIAQQNPLRVDLLPLRLIPFNNSRLLCELGGCNFCVFLSFALLFVDAAFAVAFSGRGQCHDEIIILIQESHSPFPPRIIYLVFFLFSAGFLPQRHILKE